MLGSAMRVYLVCAAFIAASGTAVAADEPEAVYAQFHSALLRDDFDTMASLSTNEGGRRAKAAQGKQPEFKGAAALAPAYRVLERKIAGERAVLKLSGRGGSYAPHAYMAGEVILLKEGAHWKVHDMTWRPTDNPPPPPRPAAAAIPAPTAAQLGDAETVYSLYHRALMEGDVALLERLSTAQHRRKTLDTPKQREQLESRQVSWLVSPFYTVAGKAAGASRTVISAKGTAGPALGGGPLEGKIVLVKDDGEWKVDDTSWAPAASAQPRPDMGTVGIVRPTAKPPVVVEGGRGRAAGAGQKAQ